jgi:hypothetical protein
MRAYAEGIRYDNIEVISGMMTQTTRTIPPGFWDVWGKNKKELKKYIGVVYAQSQYVIYNMMPLEIVRTYTYKSTRLASRGDDILFVQFPDGKVHYTNTYNYKKTYYKRLKLTWEDAIAHAEKIESKYSNRSMAIEIFRGDSCVIFANGNDMYICNSQRYLYDRLLLSGMRHKDIIYALHDIYDDVDDDIVQDTFVKLI